MARYISRHARYSLAAAAFAASGGLWCLGALVNGHGTTLLVVGMMNFAASMLIMSLRPRQELTTATDAQCERCRRDEQDVEISVRRVDAIRRQLEASDADRSGIGLGAADGTGSGQQDPDWTGGAADTLVNAGGTRPRERKSLTWSI